MASALIHGLVAKDVPPQNITACDIDESKLEELKDQCGIQTTADMRTVASTADVLVLAVKPQVMSDVCQSLTPHLKEEEQVIISIAAGVPLASFAAWLGEDKAIVRCMPNTPALVSTGATGLVANPNTAGSQRALAESVMSAVGICRWLSSESDIDAVTALSGSGPAYYFLLMEAMEQVGIEMGLDPELARSFTIQTALGAAKLAASGDVAPEELRRRVTSPGGTTQAAIETFEAEGLREIVKKALSAAQKRSVELAG